MNASGADTVLNFSGKSEPHIVYRTTSTGDTTASIGAYIYDDVLYQNISYTSPVVVDLFGFTQSNCANQYWSLTFRGDVLVNGVLYSAGQSISWHYKQEVEYKMTRP